MIAALETRNAFVEAFDRFEAADGNRPEWLVAVQRAAIARFSELGLPQRNDEDWRQTDVSPIAKASFVAATEETGAAAQVRYNGLRPHLWDDGSAHRLVFVNGRHAPRLSSLGDLPPGAMVGSLGAAIAQRAHHVEMYLGRCIEDQTQPFAALNTAFFQDGAFVYLPHGAILERPIHVLHLTVTGPERLAVHPRCLVIAEDNAQLKLVETHATLDGGRHFTNPLTEVLAGAGAIVDHYKLQRESDDALHMGTLQYRLERDSSVRSHCLTLGGVLVRHTIHVLLAGSGADCHLDGLYLTCGKQHVDNHLRVEHAAPHCDSREDFKGVLDDESSAVFTGRIVVNEGAVKTDGKQSNKNLLLSEHARVDSKPQLEIFCDDVKCTHGATIGQLDRDALFYLRCRGLPEPVARRLLVQGFAGEILDRIDLAPLRRRLQERVQQWLAERFRSEEQP